ncbi:putative transposase [Luteibacter sp. UNC138MFCol5.1]|uniref:transposase n=1 Tax=Luteibacter sp. UNC138MFCol5.1 TaxID=1502774 RepID=UPI0008B34A42|nr:transposase [Luteibacter sp. UNC138MFCol5.1]SEO93789.1 putative transposase [Luteibacter sp. UNC138MFCol5.1]
MRTKRFSEQQIADALAELASGRDPEVVCADLQITREILDAWRSRYAGAALSTVRRLRDTETELGALKRMYAELALENERLKALLSRKR